MTPVERRREWCRRYYQKHREAILAKRRAAYSANREAILAKRRAAYHLDRDAILDRRKVIRRRRAALRPLRGILCNHCLDAVVRLPSVRDVIALCETKSAGLLRENAR